MLLSLEVDKSGSFHRMKSPCFFNATSFLPVPPIMSALPMAELDVLPAELPTGKGRGGTEWREI
jgi:hypothetical protein